ncbi:MAG: GNAT family N-acyltransferase [Patescibacteria group bacterium]
MNVQKWFERKILLIFSLPVVNYRMRQYSFHIAKEDEQKYLFRLRYQVYCLEKGFLPKEDYPSEMETDQYDVYATSIVVTNQHSQVIGGIRIIPNHQKQVLTEEHYTVKQYMPNNARYAELSRFVVKKDFRNKIVSLGLIKSAIIYAINNGITHFVITCSVEHGERYKQFGFRAISFPYKYYGVDDKSLSVTLINDITDSNEKLKTLNPFFYHFLRHDHKNITIL